MFAKLLAAAFLAGTGLAAYQQSQDCVNGLRYDWIDANVDALDSTFDQVGYEYTTVATQATGSPVQYLNTYTIDDLDTRAAPEAAHLKVPESVCVAFVHSLDDEDELLTFSVNMTMYNAPDATPVLPPLYTVSQEITVGHISQPVIFNRIEIFNNGFYYTEAFNEDPGNVLALGFLWENTNAHLVMTEVQCAAENVWGGAETPELLSWYPLDDGGNWIRDDGGDFVFDDYEPSDIYGDLLSDDLTCGTAARFEIIEPWYCETAINAFGISNFDYQWPTTYLSDTLQWETYADVRPVYEATPYNPATPDDEDMFPEFSWPEPQCFPTAPDCLNYIMNDFWFEWSTPAWPLNYIAWFDTCGSSLAGENRNVQGAATSVWDIRMAIYESEDGTCPDGPGQAVFCNDNRASNLDAARFPQCQGVDTVLDSFIGPVHVEQGKSYKVRLGISSNDDDTCYSGITEAGFGLLTPEYEAFGQYEPDTYFLFNTHLAFVAGGGADPHFIGFRKGQHYDVMGSSEEVYNLLTDESTQLNARFVDPGCKKETKTVMSEMGVTYKGHEIHFHPRFGATVDGERVEEGTVHYIGDKEIEYVQVIQNGNFPLAIVSTEHYQMSFEGAPTNCHGAHLLRVDFTITAFSFENTPDGLIGISREEARDVWSLNTEEFRVKDGQLFGSNFARNLYDRNVDYSHVARKAPAQHSGSHHVAHHRSTLDWFSLNQPNNMHKASQKEFEAFEAALEAEKAYAESEAAKEEEEKLIARNRI